MNALMTIENSPSVRMFTGSVKNTMSGLRNMFNTARTTTTRIEPMSVTCTPGIKAAETITAKAETKR